MLSNVLLTIAAASFVSADVTKYLVVKSDNSEINGNTLGFNHEGAGINYAFLGTSPQSSPLQYNKSSNSLLYYGTGLPFPQTFAVQGGYVQVTVAGPDAEITFDNNDTLLVNGTADVFYACKNTNDPYDYSSMSYELMYYASNAPSDCIPLTLENDASAASASTTSYTSLSVTFPTSSFQPTTLISTSESGYWNNVTDVSTTHSTFHPTSSTIISQYEGGAVKSAPSGMFAILAGAIIAMM